MRILSLTAVARLAERRCRQAAQPVPVTDVLAWLTGLDVEAGQAEAGLRLATIVGRLESTTGSDSSACLRVPSDDQRAAA